MEKNKMKIYQVTFDFKDDEFNESFLVYEKSKLMALLRGWKGLQSPCDREDIEKYGTVEVCKYSDKLQSVIEGKDTPFVLNAHNADIAKILREQGWRAEEERSCECCELYPFGLDEYQLDDDGYCPECQGEK
jgi:hypothetical protein